MEIGTDLLNGLRGRVMRPANGAKVAGFDWSGLHARFAAAHAARAQLGAGQGALRQVGGFAQIGDAGLIPAESFRGINPSDSADGKEPAALEAITPENPLPVVEEYE